MQNDEKKILKQVDISFAAPELILGVDKDEKIDMWSIGCLLYEIITKEKLFDAQDEKEIIYMVKHSLKEKKGVKIRVPHYPVHPSS